MSVLLSNKLVDPQALTFPDDPDLYDGAHVSIQLVGRRLQEEKIIALADYIGAALGT